LPVAHDCHEQPGRSPQEAEQDEVDDLVDGVEGRRDQAAEDQRRADMTRLADTLARKTPLRRGMTRRRAAELLFVLTGPALYRDFVLEAGWTPRDWTRWVASALIRDLLPDQ
jgi:hypothetical protein